MFSCARTFGCESGASGLHAFAGHQPSQSQEIRGAATVGQFALALTDYCQQAPFRFGNDLITDELNKMWQD